MHGTNSVTNVVIAGLGGQGVVKASDIFAEAVFRAGYDVKKSEIHGMSQRGGSVSSDIRFGDEVFSPMAPPGEAHFLVVLVEDQVEPNRRRLRPDGVLLTPSSLPGYVDEDADEDDDEETRLKLRSMNVALLGALSTRLSIPEETWIEALRAKLPPRTHAFNEEVFRIGRALGAAENE